MWTRRVAGRRDGLGKEGVSKGGRSMELLRMVDIAQMDVSEARGSWLGAADLEPAGGKGGSS